MTFPEYYAKQIANGHKTLFNLSANITEYYQKLPNAILKLNINQQLYNTKVICLDKHLFAIGFMCTNNVGQNKLFILNNLNGLLTYSNSDNIYKKCNFDGICNNIFCKYSHEEFKIRFKNMQAIIKLSLMKYEIDIVNFLSRIRVVELLDKIDHIMFDEKSIFDNYARNLWNTIEMVNIRAGNIICVPDYKEYIIEQRKSKKSQIESNSQYHYYKSMQESFQPKSKDSIIREPQKQSHKKRDKSRSKSPNKRQKKSDTLDDIIAKVIAKYTS